MKRREMIKKYEKFGLSAVSNEAMFFQSDEKHDQLWEKLRTEERGRERLELARDIITEICNRAEISEEVVTVAIQIYEQTLTTDLVNNFSIGVLSVAAIYTACRDQQIPRTINDIIDVSGTLIIKYNESAQMEHYAGSNITDKTTAERVYRKICDRLDYNYLPIDPKKFANRFCNELELGPEAREVVQVVIGQLDAQVMSRYHPTTIASGAIYYVNLRLELDISQADIQEVSDCSKNSIRKSYREIIKSLND